MRAFRYSAYGLTLESDRPLEGLLSGTPGRRPDLRIELDGAWDPEIDQDPSAWRLVRHRPPCAVWTTVSSSRPGIRLRFGTTEHHIEFTITESGSRIRARRTGACTIDDVEALLLGPVLTCTLRARGVTCLHASVVAIGHQAVVILGESGAGKSTTAAGLLRLGARLIADDLAVVMESVGGFRVHRGHRRLRLRSEAATTFAPRGDLPRVWPDLPGRPERRYLEVPEDDADGDSEPLPLAAAYALLDRGPEDECVVIEPLSAARGHLTLLSHAAASFLLPMVGPRAEFHRLARLALGVPVRAVRRGEGIEHVDAVCRAIRADIMALARRSEVASIPT